MRDTIGNRMTALNFALHDDCVLITTDSLGSGDDHVPRSFHTKVFPLPHVNGVICGTGALPLVLDWFVFVQLQLVAREVRFLSECAAAKLPEMAARSDLRFTWQFDYLPLWLGFRVAPLSGLR